MQILRIILMVCFVFTVYPSIGEAVDMEEGSKTKSTLKATTSHPLSLNIDPNTEQIKTAPDAGENSNGFYLDEGYVEARDGEELGVMESEGEPLLRNGAPSVSESTHLNERILQHQKKSLATPTEDDGY